MGLLDDVLKEVGAAGAGPRAGTGAASGDAFRNLASELAGMLSGGGASGGLTSLVNMFNQKGLGNVVSSWIATGKNLPIDAEQIQSVLGSARVQALAAKAGISPEAASAAIAKILPDLVDKCTPDGQMPSVGGLLDSLAGLFKKS